MEILLIALLIAVVSALNIVCFFVGAKVGQKVSKGEPIEMPSLNPMKVIQEHREQEEAKKKQNEIETIMRNIEKYDGTGYGQEDVPRG
jgi:hypothetical protein